jgi:hypothetical protein
VRGRADGRAGAGLERCLTYEVGELRAREAVRALCQGLRLHSAAFKTRGNNDYKIKRAGGGDSSHHRRAPRAGACGGRAGAGRSADGCGGVSD